jgi:legumain
MKSIVAALGVTSAAATSHYAVLVAGSSGYSNYRHQADVCHAYQVVRSKGIPAENIVVMAYDDIANNPSNPFPGQLFNKPTPAGTPGTDVYAGCNIDYKGADVTPANFVNVLTGQGSGKVLTSTSEDNVFIFFSDHGAAGLIAFPTQEMHVSEFQGALQTMSDKKMFNKLTFYLETCESGSMFVNMNIPGVYGLSAANPTESSWGTYCGTEAKVNGKSINSCLGDLFSVSWMEDADAKDLAQETMTEQFQTVKTLTDRSEVMQWGDLTFGGDKAIEHEGGGAASNQPSLVSTRPGANKVSARQVDLHRLYSMYAEATTAADRLAIGKELQTELAQQIAVEAAYARFVSNLYSDEAKQSDIMTGKSAPSSEECEMGVHQIFKGSEQFDANTGFALQFHQVAVNVCNDNKAANGFDHIFDAAQKAVQTTVV